MKKYYVALFLVLAMAVTAGAAEKIHIAVFTGGHDFQKEFWTLFAGYDELDVTRYEHPNANKIFTNGTAEKYDAIVLYGMWQKISAAEKEGFIKYLKNGGGLVALHHCIAGYQNWEQWPEIIGGLYITGKEPKKIDGKKYGPSGFKHDVKLPVKVVNKNHPITKGLPEKFTLLDEWYGNVYIDPNVKPLLATDHPKSMPKLAWVVDFGKANICYIQCGHDRHSYLDMNYRNLVINAIHWAAKKK